ncbi:hypothetical protein [Micromonospora aurantiaca (nom. illeg.)]|uniref:hypothetical protein n=1 Tax=Micromonospora aurantiaca (nom. illeg.) TaxID=47850 RepID=UPI0033CA90E7
MTQPDTDIDLALDDSQETVYEVNRWRWLFNATLPALLVPTFTVAWADLADQKQYIPSCVLAFIALVSLGVFALVMEYRADHR